MDDAPIIDSSPEVPEVPEATSDDTSAPKATSANIFASETLVSEAIAGTVILNFLKALASGRTAKSQGYSYHRTIKYLNNHNLLPANFTTVSYGVMKCRKLANKSSMI